MVWYALVRLQVQEFLDTGHHDIVGGGRLSRIESVQLCPEHLKLVNVGVVVIFALDEVVVNKF